MCTGAVAAATGKRAPAGYAPIGGVVVPAAVHRLLNGRD
jgi:hypothetical protein